ncbi:ribosomal protein S4 [Iris pallida]|uniref:Ribosomal protein S4 (Mitochondrion) n=1 Tax=Iris pallida TaxID=29817 RepID=A0AAX6FN58_IRIPA|nr:ribosomal protein S4 [Iris pallida]
MPALRFKTCRLLSGNVRNKELSRIQRRIRRRLRKKRRSMKINPFFLEKPKQKPQITNYKKVAPLL